MTGNISDESITAAGSATADEATSIADVGALDVVMADAGSATAGAAATGPEMGGTYTSVYASLTKSAHASGATS